jgi:cytochrome c oxidase assembly protein subunit 15
MRVPEITPRGYRQLMAVILGLLAVIIVTGAAVRLSNSGLGCPDWPRCNPRNFVSVQNQHTTIEQLNRLLSGAIGVPIGLALVASYRRRPRRRDLIALAWVLFALFWAEAVLGGIVVLVNLAWVSVMGHFLIAIALVGIAQTMYHRAGEPEAPARPTVSPGARLIGRAIYVWTIWVLIAGTLVTAAGPHGGDRNVRRLGYPLEDLARIHGISVNILIGGVIVLIVALWLDRAPRRVFFTVEAMLGAMVVQAIIGYVQYFNQIPPLLVGFHVAGAVLVFGTVQQLQLEMRARAAVTAHDSAPMVTTAPAIVDAG